MICYQKELLELLPPWLRTAMQDTLVVREAREIRIRVGQPSQIITGQKEFYPSTRRCSVEDIMYVVNNASGFSAYAATSVAKGYITAPGGHRIGICGSGITHNGNQSGIKDITSICIRVARDIPGVARGLEKKLKQGSVLILGPPGCGKTTLLRDLIRQIAEIRKEQVSVVDERCELFPSFRSQLQFMPGTRTDVMSDIPKASGISMVLRSMCPVWIAVDEITSVQDCDVMEESSYTGVRFLATVHAETVDDLWQRPVYNRLIKTMLFDIVISMKRDMSYTVEELRFG